MRIRVMQFCALNALVLAALTAHADKNVDERLAADPRGSVAINNVAGSVDLRGWDKAEVEVTGTAGSDVDHVSVSGDPGHVTVQVITRQNRLWGSDGSAHLTVHVPARSSVTATLVSADFKVSGLLGDLQLQSVSGEVEGEVGGDLRAGSVSGDIRLSARSAKSIAVKTVSGDITLGGGSGETDVSTVSGTIKVEEGLQSRAHFKSVSGDVTAKLSMTGDAQVDGESVSGNIDLGFTALPSADFDVQSFSGDIKNCFGPKPVEPRHGPGSRLAFKNGESNARVQISTKSGDVRLCTEHAPPTKP
jgi:Putative adhesin